MLLNDRAIRNLCVTGEEFFVPRIEGDQFIFASYMVGKPLVNPFVEPFQGNNVISYGLTSAGYDLRLDNEEVLISKNTFCEAIDPKRFKEPGYCEKVFDKRTFAPHAQIVIPPNGYILGRSYEYLFIPYFLKGRCVGKSTYARANIIVNVTPLEPEWEGHLTIEISNPTQSHVVVHALEGIAQLEYELLIDRPETTYKDKNGKYQNQTGVTPSRVK